MLFDAKPWASFCRLSFFIMGLLPLRSVGPEPEMSNVMGIFAAAWLGIVNVPAISPVAVCKITGVSVKVVS
jgi:hypothetical protein